MLPLLTWASGWQKINTFARKMNIKTKIKKGKAYKFHEIVGTKGKFRFKTKIFEDGSGEYTVHYGKEFLDSREDGNFKMWNKDVEFEMKKIQALDDFFNEVDKVLEFAKDEK